MKEGTEVLRRSITDSRGFTLIEMAIVLIIIGIIIGAVVKGKDVIRGGEQKKVYSKFLNEWRTAYLNFYDRTGKVLGDQNALDGKADTNAGGGSPTDAGRNGLVEGDAGNPPTYYGLEQVGLNAPSTNTNDAWMYRYTDSTGKSHNITIAFDNDGTENYNYILIENIPTELAFSIDTMVDGSADGLKGDFIGDGPDGQVWGNTPELDTTARWKMEF